jgi:multidrug efflux pump subunit AcrA (membrane-fusion protein)
MINSRRIIYLISSCGFALLLAACSGTGARAAAPRGSRGGPEVAVSVATSPAIIEDVPVYLTGLGNVVGYNTVVVKSRIDGQLLEVPIREGQEVQKGQVLALIDPRPYQVALKQAQANLYKDKAALEDAKLNAKRCGAEGVGADRVHDRIVDDFADRGTDSAAVHGRHRGAVVPRIRGDAGSDDIGVGVRIADTDADDVGEAAAAQEVGYESSGGGRRTSAGARRRCRQRIRVQSSSATPGANARLLFQR